MNKEDDLSSLYQKSIIFWRSSKITQFENKIHPTLQPWLFKDNNLIRISLCRFILYILTFERAFRPFLKFVDNLSKAKNLVLVRFLRICVIKKFSFKKYKVQPMSKIIEGFDHLNNLTLLFQYFTLNLN